ncbi:lysine-2,3-aminomutase-like protein [Microvirga sp. W0021]|uniref:Lysine-2,3-aminomutase-like protein n=1 Tax=Hohaiivirga grylli TaxID=3133970 RepID=A0ABV0BHW4_9HYPH
MTLTLKTVDHLISSGLVSEDQRIDMEKIAKTYAIAVSPLLASLINPDDPKDPIGLQFVPAISELTHTNEELADPIGDHAHTPVKGIVHRYPDRVLLKAVHICPVYCRFCFRREMVGPAGDGSLTDTELENAIAYITKNKQIWEVILTGGDPLILSERRLRNIMTVLSKIEHIRVIRFHSRIPVANPERIDDAFVSALTASGKTVYIAIHSNHPRELSQPMKEACERLQKAGIQLLSQTVLLKDINDDAQVLSELMQGFVSLGIRPYYLHHPDLAPGTSHFRISISEGRQIFEQLRGYISGLCQPTYVIDIPGGFGKVPVTKDYIDDTAPECIRIRDYQGNWHNYPPRP